MTKITKKFAILLLSLIALTGCKKSCSNPSTLEADHTVIIYIVADNNLNSYAVNNINDLEEAYSAECGGRILVFYNSVSESKIIEIVNDNTASIASTTLYTYTNSPNPLEAATLSEVIDRCRSLSVTDKYSLVLWSHATGWLPEGMSPAKTAQSTQSVSEFNIIELTSESEITPQQRTFGSTYSFDGEMEVYELQQALPTDLVFEYIMVDACHMGSIEVAYELKDNCKYYCASAAEVLAEGFPYYDVFDNLISGDIARAAQKYYDQYNALSGSSRTATISVVESSKLSAVAAQLKKLTAYDTQLTATQQFGRYLGKNYNYTDLMWDTQEMVELSWGASSAESFVSALNDAVVYKAATPILFEGDYYGQIEVNTFCGLSIYIPTLSEPETLEIYKNNYSWAKDTELYLLAK